MTSEVKIPNIVFCNSVAQPITAATESSSFYNNQYEQLLVNISGVTALNLIVEGCVQYNDASGNILEDAECSWTTLSNINLQTLAFSTSINNNGLFAVNISGVIRLRIRVVSVTGSATITGTWR